MCFLKLLLRYSLLHGYSFSTRYAYIHFSLHSLGRASAIKLNLVRLGFKLKCQVQLFEKNPEYEERDFLELSEGIRLFGQTYYLVVLFHLAIVLGLG